MIPTTNMSDAVFEMIAGKETVYSVFARLVKDRILYLRGEVNQMIADVLVAQMMFLNSRDTQTPITLYINSPGGVVTDGLAIFDMMQYIDAPVNTVGTGQCCSMGSFLLSAGTGERVVMPNCRLMYHQVSGGAQGNIQDMDIQLEESKRLNDKLITYLSNFTGGKVTPDKMKELTKRDKWMDHKEAIEMGFVDKIAERINDKSKSKSKNK